MRWILHAVASLPAAVLGLIAGGIIGTACSRWYRISSFEGASGYFVVGIALLGAAVAFLAGLTTAGLLNPPVGASYLKTIGLSLAAVLVLSAAAAGVSRMLADVPPTIDGHELLLEVEFKLPVGITESPVDGTGENVFTLYSVRNRTVRESERGTLDVASARCEGGRWIVPATVSLFTSRGSRTIDFMLHGKQMGGFLLLLPGHPGREFLEWSEWSPRPRAPHPPWPDTSVSYRFRVRVFGPPPPIPTGEGIDTNRQTDLSPAP